MKRILFLGLTCLVLTGCFGIGESSNDAGSTTGVFLKSTDNGKTFTPFVARDEKGTINNATVLSVAIDPLNTQNIFLGTKNSGIIKSEDAAVSWKNINFPPNKVYGIVINADRSDEMYAAGVWEDVSKIYKSSDGGANWDEIYLEPKKGTVITSLALHPQNPRVLYAGMSSGVVIASHDAGATWQAVHTAKDAVTEIVFDQNNGDVLYILVHRKHVLVSRDGGATFEDISREIANTFKRITPTAIAIDPSQENRIYVGSTSGVYRSDDVGATWEALPVVGSTDGISIHALSVNPFDAEQITYAAGQAIYTSRSDAASQWTISEAASGLRVDEIVYDPFDPSVIYAGLREK